MTAHPILRVQVVKHGCQLTFDHSQAMMRELSQSYYHGVMAQDPNICQTKPLTRPHHHIALVFVQVFEPQGRSLDVTI